MFGKINTENGMECKLAAKPSLLVNLEELKKNEINRRRIIRLQQVRQQSKDIARKVRQKVQYERERQLTLFEREETARERNRRATRLLSLQQKYEESLNDIGNSHKVATVQPDASTIQNLQQQQDRSLAVERGRIAVEQLRLQKQKIEEPQKNILNLKERQHRYSRNIDDLRSTMVASNKKAEITETLKNKQNKQPLKEVHGNISVSHNPTVLAIHKNEEKKTLKENKSSVKNSKIEKELRTNTRKLLGGNVLPLNKQPLKKEKLIVPKHVPLVKQQPTDTSVHETSNTIAKENQSSKNTNKGGKISKNMTRKIDNSKSISEESNNFKNKPSVNESVKVICPPCPWRDGKSTEYVSKTSSKKTVCPPCPFKGEIDKVAPEDILENDVLEFDDRSPWKDSENEHEADLELCDNHLDSRKERHHENVKDMGEKVDKAIEDTQSTCSSKSKIGSSLSQKQKVQLYDHRLRYEKHIDKECMVETITDMSGPSAIETAREVEAQLEKEMKEKTESMKYLEAQCQDRGQKALERERIIRDSRQLFSNLAELSRQERQLRSTNALGTLQDVHLLDERRKALTAMRQKQMDTMFESIWHSVYSTNVQKTKLPPPLIQEEDLNTTAPAMLNVAVCNDTSAHSPEKISTGISKDEEALNQLMERVRIQRALLYDEIGEHLHIPPNERFSSNVADTRGHQSENDNGNENQQNIITLNMEDSGAKPGKVTDKSCECDGIKNDTENEDFSSLNVERGTLTCQSAISLDMSVSKVTEHEEIISTSSSTTNTTTVCEGVKIVLSVQEMSGSVFHTSYKSPHPQKVKISSSPKKLKVSARKHEKSAKTSPLNAEKELPDDDDVHTSDDDVVDDRQEKTSSHRKKDILYRVDSPAAWSEPCSSSTSYYSPPYNIHRTNKDTKSKKISVDDNSTKTSYLSPPTVISDDQMDNVDRIVTIIQEQKIKLDEVLSEMTGRDLKKHMKDKDVQVSVDLEKYINRLLLMSRASVEKLTVTLTDSQSSSPSVNRLTPQHVLPSPHNIDKCKCDEVKSDQKISCEHHPVSPEYHPHTSEIQTSNLPSPHFQQIKPQQDKSTFVDINHKEFSQQNSNIHKPDYCFCAREPESHKQPSYNLSSLETTAPSPTVLNKPGFVTPRPDSCLCPPVSASEDHSSFQQSPLKSSYIPYYISVDHEKTPTDTYFYRPSLSEIIRDLSLEEHKIRKFPQWHGECEDISKRFISRIASLSEEIEQIRQEKLKFQKTSQMISLPNLDVSVTSPESLFSLSSTSPKLTPPDNSMCRAPVTASFNDCLSHCPFPVSNLADLNVSSCSTTFQNSDLSDDSFSYQKEGKTSWREVLFSSGAIQTSNRETTLEYEMDSEDQQIYLHERKRPPPSRNNLMGSPVHELSTIMEVDTPQASATKRIMECKETKDESFTDSHLQYSSHDEADDTWPNVMEEMIRRRLITSSFPLDDLTPEDGITNDTNGNEIPNGELLSSQESVNLDHFVNIFHVCTEECKFSSKHKKV